MATATLDKTVQMNLRVKESLKRNGDRAWARLGRTPSEMARSLWRYGEKNESNLQALQALSTFLDGSGTESEIDSPTNKLKDMREVRELADAFRRKHCFRQGLPRDFEDLDTYLDHLREEETISALREEGF